MTVLSMPTPHVEEGMGQELQKNSGVRQFFYCTGREKEREGKKESERDKEIDRQIDK